MRWLLPLALLVVSCGEQTSADPAPDLEPPLDLLAEVSKEQVKLLEPFDLRLYLYRDKGLELEFEPSVPEGFDGGRIQEQARRPTKTGEVIVYRGTLRPLRLGEVAIPAYTVKAGAQEASSGEILIQVESILGEDPDLAAIEAPAPLFPPRVNFLPWVLGAAGLLLLVLLLVWFLRRPPRTVHPTETPLQPHVKALRALATLKSRPRQTEAEVEAFYVDVSQVLRIYLEERFGLHAPERTTEEFLAEIERGDTLTLEQRQSLGQFLEQCDLVKFARLIPESQVHERTFQIALAFVEQTRPDRIPAGGAA